MLVNNISYIRMIIVDLAPKQVLLKAYYPMSVKISVCFSIQPGCDFAVSLLIFSSRPYSIARVPNPEMAASMARVTGSGDNSLKFVFLNVFADV